MPKKKSDARVMSLRIDPEMYKWLTTTGRKFGISRSRVAREALLAAKDGPRAATTIGLPGWRLIKYSDDPLMDILIPEDADVEEVLKKVLKIVELMG